MRINFVGNVWLGIKRYGDARIAAWGYQCVEVVFADIIKLILFIESNNGMAISFGLPICGRSAHIYLFGISLGLLSVNVLLPSNDS
jgi:hypothetical protein